MLSLHSIFTERMCEDLHQTRLQMFAKIQLEVSHSCQEMIQTLRRMLCSIYMACRQDAQDTMRENTGPSRDLQLMRKAKAAKKPGSQLYVSSCRRFRSSAAYSEAMMSHRCLVPAVVHLLMLSSVSSCTPPCRSDLFTNTTVQPRRGRMMTSWTQTHLSSPRSCQGPRCQGDRGSNVPCIAGGCVLTISDDDHGEIQRQHLSSFCTYICYFILLVLASNQSCLTRLTIRSKD